ncbi:unnamed protein product [Blepharisma stoltei]|uniref:VTT domain-containing protein n=1 Tax=Blepharisma stoltei TaxID=1481888 RepID=A0AAU9JH12_9CILI|nr:unnamed protein product [Blepharisma stoltei]
MEERVKANIEKLKAETQQHLGRNKLILLFLFVFAIIGFYLVINSAPAFTDAEKEKIFRFPNTAEKLGEMSHVISKYTEKYYVYVIFILSYLLILLWTFLLPGAPLLFVLSGALLGFWTSMIMATISLAIGSALSYILIETVGKGIAIRLFPNPISKAYTNVEKHKHNLFFYILSLRVMPFVPKWIMTMSSPIIGVSFNTFLVTAVLGLLPHIFIFVNTGTTLTSISDLGLNRYSILSLAGLAALSLLPTFFTKKTVQDEDKEEDISPKKD